MFRVNTRVMAVVVKRKNDLKSEKGNSQRRLPLGPRQKEIRDQVCQLKCREEEEGARVKGKARGENGRSRLLLVTGTWTCREKTMRSFLLQSMQSQIVISCMNLPYDQGQNQSQRNLKRTLDLQLSALKGPLMDPRNRCRLGHKASQT